MRIFLVLLLALVITLTLTWFFAPGPMYYAAVGLERQLAGLDSRTVRVQGTRWAYTDGGSGAPLLLLHGFGADKDNWNRVARHLTDRYRVVAPDLPGFGDSDPAADGYTIAAQAQRLFEFADAIGLRRFHLGGNSMGGYIALAMARRHPERVESVWLLAPAGVAAAPVSPFVETVLQGETNPLIPSSPEQFEQTLELVFEQRPFLPGPMIDYLAERQVARQELYQSIFQDVGFGSQPSETFAQGLTVPALIVWGERDRVLHPDGGPILAGLLASDTLILMPGIGHLPMVEDPLGTATDYIQWRQQVSRSPGTVQP
ncbi:MAG: alpha/beta fold hydrolase [Xanthomonadales bacterium]|nr:alpha/beta fold hydrolase [Xanthomonadales bacterium]